MPVIPGQVTRVTTFTSSQLTLSEEKWRTLPLPIFTVQGAYSMGVALVGVFLAVIRSAYSGDGT
jgi:hypothetical protein